MNEYNTDLERRLRAVESKSYPPYKTLVFNKEDCFFHENEYTLSFNAVKNTEIIITSTFYAEQAVTFDLYLNDVKINGYKSVIGKNLFIVKCSGTGKQILKAKFNGAITTELKFYVSGYIENFAYDGTMEILRCGDNIYVMAYDELKFITTVYKINNVSLETICSVSDVKSSGLSLSDDGLFNLYCVDLNGNLSVAKVKEGQNLVFTLIDTSVSKVSGALFDTEGGCFFIKNKAVYSAKKVSGVIKITDYGIKNAYEIRSTPSYSGSFIVIGYDKNSTLYVK